MLDFGRLQERRFVLVNLLPWLAYCLLIFWLSAQSHPERLSPIAIPDKLAHLVLYAGYGFLCMRLLLALADDEVRAEPVRFLVWSLSAALLYGLSDEIHQLFVPRREFSWMDLLADGAGGYLGARVWVLLHKPETDEVRR